MSYLLSHFWLFFKDQISWWKDLYETLNLICRCNKNNRSLKKSRKRLRWRKWWKREVLPSWVNLISSSLSCACLSVSPQEIPRSLIKKLHVFKGAFQLCTRLIPVYSSGWSCSRDSKRLENERSRLNQRENKEKRRKMRGEEKLKCVKKERD